MLGHVGQQLLNGAKYDELQVLRHFHFRHRDLALDPNRAVRLLEGTAEPFDRRQQAQVIQQTGPQFGGDSSHIVEHFAQAADRAVQQVDPFRMRAIHDAPHPLFDHELRHHDQRHDAAMELRATRERSSSRLRSNPFASRRKSGASVFIDSLTRLAWLL